MSTLINLNLLPAPDSVEPLDFETIFNRRKARLIELYPDADRAELINTLAFESEPIVKLLQENAYEELLLRQRINNAARAVMLAHATGTDLDNIAANFNVTRLVISPEDLSVTPPRAAVYETDDNLRLRAQQAYEGLSTAGPSASYQYHARSADGRVSDVFVSSPTPAHVDVTILSGDGDGAAGDELIHIVERALNDERVRPIADRVSVNSAEIVNYEIDALIYAYPTPEIEPILTAADEKLKNYITTQRRLGRDIRLSAIYAALTVEGVQRVELITPQDDVILTPTQAAYCTCYEVKFGGFDE